MSTENEAGAVTGAESAAPGPEGAAPDGAPATTPAGPGFTDGPAAAPAADAAPAAGPARTEAGPAQAPGQAPVPANAPAPVGPPSPYGPPPTPYDAPKPAAFAAQPPPAGPAGSPDPFAVPATPAYGPPSPPGAGAGPGGPGGPVWGAPAPVPPGPRRRGAGGLVAAVLAAALVAGGVGGGIGYWAAQRGDDTSGSTTVSSVSDPKTFNRPPTSVAGIAGRALPSVVTIKASGSQESGTGTGFVYDKQGHILTNNHVVAPAADGGKLTVTFSNGNTYDAVVVGRAQGYDVAVVKLKNAAGVHLAPLPLGNSDQSRVGDATIAIGAPFGLSGTVTTGIVSAVHRPVASSDGQGSSASYMSAIQTDASINPGNSGGPLLNAAGAVIGINSAIQSAGTSGAGGQAGSVGLGFAIPINQAKRVADQLIATGRPVYPLIGVSLDTQYQGDGARIGSTPGSITPGGPGDKAGLQPGDVITKFDSTLIDSGQTLIGEIWQHQPGDKATLTYTRNGTTHTATLTLGQRAGDTAN